MPTRPDGVLLDTHVLLWWRAGGARLSATAASVLSGAPALLVSPITCWEVGMLVAKARVALDRPTTAWVRDVLAHPRVEIAELRPVAAVAAAELPDFHGDPADRLLYTTALALRVPFVTKDGAIHDYAAAHRDVTVRW